MQQHGLFGPKNAREERALRTRRVQVGLTREDRADPDEQQRRELTQWFRDTIGPLGWFLRWFSFSCMHQDGWHQWSGRISAGQE